MIVKQRLGKKSTRAGRIYIEDEKLSLLGLSTDNTYSVAIDKGSNLITVKADAGGKKVIQHVKNGRIIPVIDTQNNNIKEALEECSYIKITFIMDNEGGRVIIQGEKDTASIVKANEIPTIRKLSCITFCAGTSITSTGNEAAGYDEIAAVEYYPKENNENRYSDIYSINHPNSIMFNIPMERLSADDLPYAHSWIATLDCTRYSKAGKKTTDEDLNNGESSTLHLFMHLMRLFWTTKKSKRPLSILIENVEGFRTAAYPLGFSLRDEGYSVKIAVLNSKDFGSRTSRKRLFFVACAYDGFEFPSPTGELTTPIEADGVITLESLEWITPQDNATLKYYVERNNSISHNHKIKAYDITKDRYVGTITKTSHSMKPELLIKHPVLKDTYAELKDPKHLRYLHSIPESMYLGEGRKAITEAIGQGVCYKTYYTIIKKLHDFLYNKVFNSVKEIRYEQLQIAI